MKNLRITLTDTDMEFLAALYPNTAQQREHIAQLISSSLSRAVARKLAEDQKRMAQLVDLRQMQAEKLAALQKSQEMKRAMREAQQEIA